MQITLTEKMREGATQGICPFCSNDSLEGNEDETQIAKGYTDYCYTCNAPVKITGKYASKPVIEHYQF